MQQYVFDNDLTTKATNNLLLLLKLLGHENIPRTRRQLFPIKAITMNDLITIEPGQYVHIGLKTYASQIYERTKQVKCTIDIFIDGASIAKSSNRSIWVISGRDVTNSFKPFLIGCYSGLQQPSDFDRFLEPLVLDWQQNEQGRLRRCFLTDIIYK